MNVIFRKWMEQMSFLKDNLGQTAMTAAVLALIVGISLSATNTASSQRQESGPVLIPSAHACAPPIDAGFMACAHDLHGHSQWRHGEGTPGHTWTEYKREARVLREYLRRVSN